MSTQRPRRKRVQGAAPGGAWGVPTKLIPFHVGELRASSVLRNPTIWLACLAWALFLGGLIAASVNTVLVGRLPLLATVRGLLGNPLSAIVLAVVALWWLSYAVLVLRTSQNIAWAMLLPAIPILAGMALPLLAIHLSDTVNHYFYYGMVHLNQPKTLTLLLILIVATVLLQSISVEAGRMPRGPAVAKALEKMLDPLIIVLFLVMGVLQAAAYMPPPGQDFVRYWLVADALGQGLPYAANTAVDSANQSIGMTAFIIDLPLFPVLMAWSFAVFGHTVAAAYLPIAAFNSILPVATYLLFRQFIPNRPVAVSFASLVVLFPLLRFYTLNFPVPDAIFLTCLILCIWLFVRIVREDRSAAEWAAFGALAAAVALVRTEGIAYASLYVLVAIVGRATWRQRGSAVVAYLLPMGLFSISLWSSFGTPWPHTFAGALAPKNLAINLPVLVANEFFTAAIRIPSPYLAVGWGLLLVLALVGSTPFVHHPRRLAMVFLPAWVNLASVLLADPRVSGARLWFDFFRHVSYVFPLFVLAAGIVLSDGLRRLPRTSLRTTGLIVLNVLLFAGVMWDTHCLSKPSWSFGPDAVNLVSQERPNLVDYFDHRYELPVIGYELSGSHSEPVFRSEFFATYPDPLADFYRPFDAVKLLTGAAYETASRLIYLAALLLALLPGMLDRICVRHPVSARQQLTGTPAIE